MSVTITSFESTDDVQEGTGSVPLSRFLSATVGWDKIKAVHYPDADAVFTAVRSSAYLPLEVKEEDFAWLKSRGPELAIKRMEEARKHEDTKCLTTSLLFQTTHDCFATHQSVSLSPEVLWYTILHEVGTAVKTSPEKYASLFTTTPNVKTEIIVEVPDFVYGSMHNDWARGIELFRPELLARVPSTIMRDALPTFTTATPASEVAHLVAFMDAASPYYEYGMRTMCGIPKVRLEGEPEDWQKLVDGARALSTPMAPDLALYFEHLIPVLETLAAAVRGEEVEASFWNSMVKIDGGSGGPYVSGWITVFWNYVNDGGIRAKPVSFYSWKNGRSFSGLRPDQFTSHVSQVPFTWYYLSTKIPMSLVSGVLSVVKDGEFFCPRLNYAVVELTPTAP